MELSGAARNVLHDYPKAVFHMRSQLTRQKFMPIFGAGVGRDLNLPGWGDLVRAISEHPDIDGAQLDVSRASNTSLTQMLYQHFRLRCQKRLQQGLTAADERACKSKWSSIIHECLYEKAKDASEHPYLSAFVEIIKKSPLTVNYNFDDYIEELLDRSIKTENDKGYETVWEPTVQYRRSQGVIYHPNGFLPRKLQRGSSSWLVFSDDSFEDQMIDAQRGHYSTLLSHLFRFTSLLIGLSLEDPTLRQLLRQNALANPGHVHYYVAYTDNGRTHSKSRTAASRESNFSTYNLVTLFLDAQGIRGLAELLEMSDQQFAMYASELSLPRSYLYFLSGAVGGGKTSCLAYFKSLTTFDEWIDPKPDLILKPADSLTAFERTAVDEWINKQFARKNFLVGRAESQLCVIDRSLVDPLAFAPESKRKNRARALMNLYKTKEGIAEGEVILLTGIPEVMQSRIEQRHKGGSSSYIASLQGDFISMWEKAGTVRTVDTMDKSIHQVAKEVSRIIHLEEYSCAPIAKLLAGVAKGRS